MVINARKEFDHLRYSESCERCAVNSTYKRTLFAVIIISVACFIIFIFPNNTGAKDQNMISIFEGDESAQYGVVMKMFNPYPEIKDAILNFIAYRHYYYGSPFYFSSALSLFPVKLVKNIHKTTQLNMLLLRQFISVLPMLGAIFTLTYMQTRFKSLIKSVGLFIFLLSVSAVVENNLWWHADALAVFFVTLTIFFLDRDDLCFGFNFYLAAVCTGLAAGTKVIGLFFFLAIPVYIVVGLVRGLLTWRTAFFRAAAFVGFMVATIVLSNPFMLLPSQFIRMIRILSNQSASMSVGWILFYDKGPASWLPILNDLYGRSIFLVLAMIALFLGIWKSENRLRHLIIAAWAIPYGLYILFVIAIKPTHFFLPILLPVYSSLIILFEFPPFTRFSTPKWTGFIWGTFVIAVIGFQFVTYLTKDVALYTDILAREDTNRSMVFYDTIARDYLPRIPVDQQLEVFRDVKMYFPRMSKWVVRGYWNSNYQTIEKIRPDIIILWPQRIADYTHPGVQEQAIDPASFQDTYQFYIDVDNNRLRGYKLVYRDESGLMFVSDILYEQYFGK